MDRKQLAAGISQYYNTRIYIYRVEITLTFSWCFFSLNFVL